MTKRLWFGVGLLVVSVACATAATERDRIVVTEGRDRFELTVPVSALLMTIPKGGFRQVGDSGASASKRYFHLRDAETHVTLSGWFEPDSGFQGITKFWDAEVAAWKRNGLPDPKDVTFIKVGRWAAITYQIELPTGFNSHIRAHWVQGGTWIDLHLSTTSTASASENLVALRSLLERIEVSEK